MDKMQWLTLYTVLVLGYLQIKQELTQIKNLLKMQKERNESLHKETVEIVDQIVEHHLKEEEK